MIDRDRNTILHIAAKFGNLKMARRIVVTCEEANKTTEFLGLRNSEETTAEESNVKVGGFLEWAQEQANGKSYCLANAPYCIVIYAAKERKGALKEKRDLVRKLNKLGIANINEYKAKSRGSVLWAISEARKTRFKSALLVCLMCHGIDYSICTEDKRRVSYNEIFIEMNEVIPAGLPKVREMNLWYMITYRIALQIMDS